tara:strand:- start:1223 stop:1396 length:174 start_codon:yes stop_codon:yes gene_type:complete
MTPEEYRKNRAAYIEYLLMCVRLGDWHGVSDAANDLRVLEAKQETLPKMRSWQEVTT